MIKHGNRYLQVHALPIYNQDHEVDGILEFYRDVTLEKTYEQQLQQADKLASLGQLVSGIGHEINNPNQFIRGNIKIIKQSIEDMLPIVDDYYKSHPDMKIARLKYDFFREHIMVLVDDMAHGSDRIKAIVEGLRTFVRKDEGLLVDTVLFFPFILCSKSYQTVPEKQYQFSGIDRRPSGLQRNVSFIARYRAEYRHSAAACFDGSDCVSNSF